MLDPVLLGTRLYELGNVVDAGMEILLPEARAFRFAGTGDLLPGFLERKSVQHDACCMSVPAPEISRARRESIPDTNVLLPPVKMPVGV